MPVAWTRHSGRLALAAILVLVACPPRLAAQRIRGEVVLPDRISPAARVIVIASGANGADVARTTTGETGKFDLPLPRGGRYRVRALRLGFQPTFAAPFDVAAADVQSLRIVLEGSIVSLAQVLVRGERVCGVRMDSGQLVADLWQQARIALLTSALDTAGQRELQATAIAYERTLDPTGVSVRAETTVVVRGTTSRPFASLPADSLARVGYVVEDKSGVVYRAPDAEVLLSESFVALHCFAAVPPPPAHLDWVGIGVTPARMRANLSDIEGTLWLDRTSAELRLFEYRYTNVSDVVARAGAGGRVEFVRLPTGHWIVSRWEIRMPRSILTRSVEGLGRLARVVTRTSVREIQMKGGEVLEVDSAGVVLYESAGAAEMMARATVPRAPEPAADTAAAAMAASAGLATSTQETILRGRVTEEGDTTMVVGGAEIELMGTSLRRFANNDGWYQFRDAEPGRYQLRVRRLGYLPSIDRVVLDAGRLLDHDVALKRPPNTLTQVRIEGKAVKVPARYVDVYRRGANGLGTFIAREEIERLNPVDVTSLFYRIPGVHVGSHGVQFMRCMDNMATGTGQGPGQGKVQVYIDGVRMTSPEIGGGFVTGSSATPSLHDMSDYEEILRLVPPTSIQAIEVYRGISQIPAEFLDDACAVIAIWTKSY